MHNPQSIKMIELHDFHLQARKSRTKALVYPLQISEDWTPQHELKSGAKSWWGTLVEMGQNGPKYQQTLGEALVTRYIIRYV